MLADFWEYLDPGFFAPLWLPLGVAAVAIFVLLEVRLHFLRQRAIRAFASSHLVATLAGSVSVMKRLIKALLLILGQRAALPVALARPLSFLMTGADETRSGVDVLLAVDCSKSMLTQDVRPSRLERAKLSISDFAAQLPADRLGLIAFAGDAFLQCPLTLDHDAIPGRRPHDLDTDTIPRPGTDIATAIDQAVRCAAIAAEQHEVSHPRSRTVRTLRGAPWTAGGEKCRAKGASGFIRWAWARPKGDRIPERARLRLSSATITIMDGNEVISHLDESTLRQIADITGGRLRAARVKRGDGLARRFTRAIPRARCRSKTLRRSGKKFTSSALSGRWVRLSFS